MIRAHYTPDDRAASVYQYLPFEVPAGAAAFTLTLAYDRSAAIVDLGLLGPEVPAGPGGFRGWSGGERSEVTVANDWATPGYLPGEPSGAWQVFLGLYRVGPAGVDVTVEIYVRRSPVAPPPAAPLPPRPERPPRRDLPATPGRSWLACDFHSHTVHSDGGLEIAELAALAAGRGLDVLAVTDHNTVSHHPHLAAAGDHVGIALLPGQEVTTDRGHANCFGEVGWVDFRQSADAWHAAADRRSGLLAVNHPWAGDCAWNLPLSRPATAVEMWHWSADTRASESWEDWTELGDVPIGGSDFHRHDPNLLPGGPTTWVEAEAPTTEAVLAAIAAGRTAISASPTAPVLLRHDGELVAVDADGCEQVPADPDHPGQGTRLVANDRVVAFCV